MEQCCRTCYYGRKKKGKILCVKWREFYEYDDCCWEYYNEGE